MSLAGSFETFCKILSAVIICHNSELGYHDFIQNTSWFKTEIQKVYQKCFDFEVNDLHWNKTIGYFNFWTSMTI